MNQLTNPAQSSRPNPNVYTALLLVAIVAIAASLVVVLSQLLSPTGYGLQFGDLFGGLLPVK